VGTGDHDVYAETGHQVVWTVDGPLCPKCAAKRETDVRICIDCGRFFIPNRGEGLPGRGRSRVRCYECSPSKLV
jgi:hypothetical protein